MNKGTLTFFCGKMGAGKSTKSKEVALENNAVLLSEDEWLESVFSGKIASVEDYIKYSNRLKPQMKKLVQSILTAGTNVVMDFPANSKQQREWFRSILSEVEAPHHLIYIEASDEVCLQQIKRRAVDRPERAATDNAEIFEKVTKYFAEPSPEEGFEMTRLIRNAPFAPLQCTSKSHW